MGNGEVIRIYKTTNQLEKSKHSNRKMDERGPVEQTLHKGRNSDGQ